MKFAKHYSNWSQVALVCSGLKQGFGSSSEIEVRSWQWESWILATRPVVCDKALALGFWRNEFPQRWKVVKQVKCVLVGGKGVKYVWKDTGVDSELHPHGSWHQLCGTFLPDFLWWSFWLAWFESIFDISQDPPVCTCTSLNQDGFHPRDVWVDFFYHQWAF